MCTEILRTLVAFAMKSCEKCGLVLCPEHEGFDRKKLIWDRQVAEKFSRW